MNRRHGDELTDRYSPAPDPPEPWKTCAVCGEEYEVDAWAGLKLVGRGCGLEHRDCHCGNTLCVEVSDGTETD